MKIKKLNDLTYVLHFDNNIQAKKLYHYMQMYGRVDKDIKTKKNITEGEEIKVGKDNKKNKENK